jgi:hypothetical protein
VDKRDERTGWHSSALHTHPRHGLQGVFITQLAVAASERLAAILAADVIGYSRLMGADEAGTLAALKRHREAAASILPRAVSLRFHPKCRHHPRELRSLAMLSAVRSASADNVIVGLAVPTVGNVQ